MNLDNIKKELSAVIHNVDKILEQEDFSAYHRIKDSLLEANALLNKGNIENALKEVGFSFRLISEAPPRNKDLALKTFHSMDALYKRLKLLS